MRVRPGVILVTMGLALLAGGCAANTKTLVVTQTVLQTRTVEKRAPMRTITVTRTATSSPRTSAASPPPGVYSGQGTKNVGTITVSAPSTLQWVCDGCGAFSVTSNIDPNASTVIAVSSQASKGTTAVDPGTYNDVQVISDGSWAFRITPG